MNVESVTVKIRASCAILLVRIMENVLSILMKITVTALVDMKDLRALSMTVLESVAMEGFVLHRIHATAQEQDSLENSVILLNVVL